MKLKWKRILSLALLALLLACAVNLPLPGQFPAVARAKGPFVIDADGVLVEYTGRGGIVRIPRGVTEIGLDVFAERDDITGVVIPNTVRVIGEGAFYKCYSLKKITLPRGVEEIGGFAFDDCFSLAKVTIPNTVEWIGTAAFQNCYSLKKVVIPNSVRVIGGAAFSGCLGLTRVTIGNGVTSIGPNAFSWCTGLTSVVIPDSVTDIGVDVFHGCPNLRFVTLPSEAQAPDFGSSTPQTVAIPDNLIPPMIALQEKQSMVLPKFKGAKVTWSVLDPAVAAIVRNRTVRGQQQGETTLILKVEQAEQGKALTLNGQPLRPGKEYEIRLAVSAKGETTVRRVAVDPGKLTLHPLGDAHGYPATAELDLTITPEDFPGGGEWKENCLYLSSNPEVAQVTLDPLTKMGRIAAIKPGKAAITVYTPNMKTAKVNVTVQGWVTSLKLKDEDENYVKRLTLDNGRTMCQLTPEFNEDAALKVVRWTSSKPAVAFVDGNGGVYGRLKGTAKITAIALDGSNKKATVIVTVTENIIA